MAFFEAYSEDFLKARVASCIVLNSPLETPDGRIDVDTFARASIAQAPYFVPRMASFAFVPSAKTRFPTDGKMFVLPN